MKLLRPAAAALGLAAALLLVLAAFRPAMAPADAAKAPPTEVEYKVIRAHPGDPQYRALEDDGWTMCSNIGGVPDDGSPAQYLFKRSKVYR
jgi:hypothetical protein